MVHIAGLVLAAGKGRRFGRPKALVVVDGALLVERAVRTMTAGGCAPVHLVLGAGRDEVLDTADLGAAVVANNPNHADGMGSSLRAGLAALPQNADAVVVALVDQPLIGPPVVRRLIDHADAADAVVASYDGRRRNPVLLHRRIWAGVADAAEGDVGAREYLRRHPQRVAAVECADVGDPADIDTVADLDALANRASLE